MIRRPTILALALKNNFSENKRPGDGNHPIDKDITNALENFFANPPSTPISPTDPDEILNYIKTLKNNKAPDLITNKMRGRPTGAVFRDIQKAFDKVWVGGLIYKLITNNFPPALIHLINSYLVNRIIITPQLRLPENIRELIRAKNRFRKLWNNTRYPPYNREVNALIRQIRKEIEAHRNRTWKNILISLNPQHNSLYNLHRKITKRATVIPPLHGPGGMAYSKFEKAEAFKDTLEVTFQENVETYCDDKIEEVENVVCNYFDNFTALTPPLTSPNGVLGN
ncbi:uncharacterized protein TNCV_3594771 [Trichonephila clavipes]|nr:uncharacterized protein TNCV_3594771 [Trichonephila clavipes]